MSEDIKVIVRGRPFSGTNVQDVKCLVTLPGGEVRVWDHISHHWTLLHSLGRTAIKSAIEAARGAK